MITDIRLQQFRSYRDASFDCSPGVNIIVGPNASGKTNLLEAILVIARGSSYRVKDQELVRFGADWARLDAHTETGLRTVKLVGEPQPAKSYELDGKTFKRISMQHTLPVVLFEPNHLQLLHGSPERRRDYLDDLLTQTEPGHAGILRNYKRVLAQRNALLKRVRKPTSDELFVWNLRLGELGAALSRRRFELAEQINGRLADEYRELSKVGSVTSLAYKPLFNPETYESQLLRKLEHDLPLDVLRGFTAAGPHREDFVVEFDGREAAETASRGETRTLLLALKIIELEILAEARGVQPLLLLDDVFSELDGSRRHALTDRLSGCQTFITTTDADIVLKNFAQKSKIIPTQAND